jgi:LPS-assembly protein
MHPRTLVCITLLALCHLQLGAQALTNVVTEARQSQPLGPAAQPSASSQLPDAPGQQLLPLALPPVLPIAQPEPSPSAGEPVRIEALHQTWSNADKTWTLSGNVVIHYRDYVVRADRIVYHQATTALEASGHLQVSGGSNDVLIRASHGVMRLNAHTARFYDVRGSQGVRMAGRTVVYSTPNPLLFSGRELIENGEGNYRIVDGSITNCRLPKPDWRIISRSIAMADGEASTSNSFFEFLGVPIFYLPYLRHAVDKGGRESGLLIPVIGTGSSIRGYTFGEQMYWAINRSMDMVVGADYYSKRGWAPNGDFRYKGPGLDHLIVHWNGLLDRGFEQEVGNTLAPAATQNGAAKPAARPADLLPGPVGEERVNQGGVDIAAEGRKDLSSRTRVAGMAEYLSSYTYRLVFDDNYSQAISSEVSSDVALTRAHNGSVRSVALDRFETFAGTANGDEVKILHLPQVRDDVVAKPLGDAPFYWGLGSSLSYLNRSEPGFHSRNVGRVDFYPHLFLPLEGGGWNVLVEASLRDTGYTISQTPDLTGANNGIPTISHQPLNRVDGEVSVDIRPPALERDFTLPFWHRELRHVIEPELTYRYVGGIGSQARNVLQFDTTDIATDTNEAGLSLTQRFYLRPTGERPCGKEDAPGSGNCPARPREWASWQIAQEYFIDPNFGGALIPGRRNIFDSTLDLTPIAFLTGPRNLSPVISRLRFEAIDNLRLQWDLDYDPKLGQLDADNLFAGYSWGRTTLGIGHALLNAVDENTGSTPTLKSQQVQPFLEIGKPSGKGLNLAVNGGYDFVQHMVQYTGVQAAYNWNCCGITLGYRRFELGTVGTVGRDETQWLYSFTLANFGGVGDIRHTKSVFRDPSLPPAY